MHKPHVASGGRYPVLRTIGILYLVGGALAALAGLFLAGWCLVGPSAAWVPIGAAPDVPDRIIGCVVMLAGTFFVALSMFAIAEILKMFIDMSNSLRVMACMTPARTDAVSEREHLAAVAGGRDGGRLSFVEDETAEAALLRGH